MSPDDDQPTSEPSPGETQATPASDAPADATGEAPAPASPDAPRRRRRRRRRKGPRPPVEGQGALADGGTIAAPGEAASAPGEGQDAAPRPQAAPGERPPRSRGPRNRNRPRRPREGGPEGAPADPNAPPREDRPRQDRPFRARGPRRDGPGGDGPRTDRPPREGEAPGQAQGERPARGRTDRPPREGFRGNRPGGPRSRDGRHGDDRRPARPEPKLITLESTVDRGFEDVPDEANEGATKRVTWTIVKRTVADQRTAKQVSATYVLKREDVDTDFPSLAAARAAVNKTIVHPEKLTLSKADHAAQRGGAGGKK